MPALCDSPKTNQLTSSICLSRRRWKTTKPPSTTWPRSFTTCTGRSWRFSRRWCEGLAGPFPALEPGRGLRLLGRWEKIEWPEPFQSIVTALNKMRKMEKQQLIPLLVGAALVPLYTLAAASRAASGGGSWCL